MKAIQIIRNTEQFPEMERVNSDKVNFYFDHSSRPYGENTQYIAVMVEVDYQQEEGKEDNLNEVKALALPDIKEYRIKQIDDYDHSSAINEFTYDDVPMWLDKDTRNGLLTRFNAEKAAGIESTTLWYGTQSFSLTVDKGIEMVNALELYASACYDKTSEHKANVIALETIEEVESYDYTTGYPEKLHF